MKFQNLATKISNRDKLYLIFDIRYWILLTLTLVIENIVIIKVFFIFYRNCNRVNRFNCATKTIQILLIIGSFELFYSKLRINTLSPSKQH